MIHYSLLLRQHRTIPALRLKHRSGGCGTSLAGAVLRIMRYCPETDELFDVSDSSRLPAFNLSCVNCNPSRAILCGTYLII